MSAGDEIITPITKPEAVSMAEIHAMRGLTDAGVSPWPSGRADERQGR